MYVGFLTWIGWNPFDGLVFSELGVAKLVVVPHIHHHPLSVSCCSKRPIRHSSPTSAEIHLINCSSAAMRSSMMGMKLWR